MKKSPSIWAAMAAEGLIDADDVPTRKRRLKPRKASLVGAVRQARKAGLNPTVIAVTAEGSIVLTFGGEMQAVNDLDQWLAKHAH